MASMSAAEKLKFAPLLAYWEQYEQRFSELSDRGLIVKDALGGIKVNPLFSFLIRRQVSPDLHHEVKAAYLLYYQHYCDWLIYLLKEEQRSSLRVKALLAAEESNLTFVIEALMRVGESLEHPFHALDILLTQQGRNRERIWWQERLLRHFEQIPKQKISDQQLIEYLALLENRALLCREQGLYAEAESIFIKAFSIVDELTVDLQVFAHKEANRSLLFSAKAIFLRNYATILREQKRWTESRKASFEALDIAKQLQDVSLQSDIWHDLANLEKASRQFQESRKYFARALWLGRRDTHKLAHLYFNLGALASDLSQYQKSSGYYQKALSFFAANGNKTYEAQCWQNFALLLEEQGEMEAARTAFHQAISLFVSMEDEFKAAQVFQNLAAFEANQIHLEESIYYIRKAAAVYERLGLVLLRAEACQNLGEVYRKMGDFEESIRQGEKAISLYHLGKEKRQLGAVYQNLGNTFMQQKRWALYSRIGLNSPAGEGTISRRQTTPKRRLIFTWSTKKICSKLAG